MNNHYELQGILESRKMDLDRQLNARTHYGQKNKAKERKNFLGQLKRVFSRPAQNGQPDCCAC